MADKVPVDETSRKAIATGLTTSFFVEAGAGTGKTQVLVDRLVRLIGLGQTSIEKIVIITFTEKAAGELRARIREELHRALATITDSSIFFRKALERLDAAPIETIHAFAGRLLREHPIEAGLDPHFRQLSEIEAELEFDHAWTNWISNLSGESFEAVARCRLLQMPLDTIRHVARRLSEYREVAGDRQKPQRPDANQCLLRMLETVHSLSLVAPKCLDQRDAAIVSFQNILKELGQLEGLKGPQLEMAVLRAREWNLQSPRKRNWPSEDDATDFDMGLRSIVEELFTFKRLSRQEAFVALLGHLADFVSESAKNRLLSGKLTFSDLLIEARRLLVSSSTTRRLLQQKYTHIFVDEFQDTDPLQAEIIFLLAADEASQGLGESPNWQSVKISAGKLLLVGDPKQSIYRFRRADIETYLKAKAVFQSPVNSTDARVESIVQNFRSVPEIINWINEVFSVEITENPLLVNAQPVYERIFAFREGSVAQPVIHLYPSADLSEERIAGVRRREASAIANLIKAMVGSDDWHIAESKEEGNSHRPVHFGDFCLLVHTRTQIDLYTQALTDARIPYVLDGGRDFFERQEIRDLAAILRALDDPSDMVALVAALKCQGFVCSDEELLDYKVSGGRFSLFAPPGKGPVWFAINRLKGLYEAKAHLSLPSFVDLVLRESFLVEASLLSRGGRQHASNLRSLVERAGDFTSDRADALRPFIHWLSGRQGDISRETESQVNESEDEVVRITTVHSAKGLEFPIVILAKLAGGEWTSRPREVVDRARSVVEFNVGTDDLRFETEGFGEAWDKEQVYQDSEARRIMYVSATRAKDYLIVPYFSSQRTPGALSHLSTFPSPSRIAAAISDKSLGHHSALPTIARARVMIDSQIPLVQLPRQSSVTFNKDLVPTWQALDSTRRGLMKEGPRFLAPSSLSADLTKMSLETEPPDRDDEEPEKDRVGDDNEAISFAAGALGTRFVGSSAGRTIGTLVHDALFHCDLSNPNDAERWATIVSSLRGTPELATEVRLHVRRAVLSDLMKRILAGKRYFRELPIVSYADGQFIEGFIDIAFEEADGFVLIDYKSDRLDHSEESLLRRYSPQLEAYATSLRSAGVRVKATGILLTSTGSTLFT